MRGVWCRELDWATDETQNNTESIRISSEFNPWLLYFSSFIASRAAILAVRRACRHRPFTGMCPAFATIGR